MRDRPLSGFLTATSAIDPEQPVEVYLRDVRSNTEGGPSSDGRGIDTKADILNVQGKPRRYGVSLGCWLGIGHAGVFEKTPKFRIPNFAEEPKYSHPFEAVRRGLLWLVLVVLPNS